MIATGPFQLAVIRDRVHVAHTALKTTHAVMMAVSEAWVGTRGKVRSCPPVVGVILGLLSAVEGEDVQARLRQTTQQPHILSQLIIGRLLLASVILRR